MMLDFVRIFDSPLFVHLIKDLKSCALNTWMCIEISCVFCCSITYGQFPHRHFWIEIRCDGNFSASRKKKFCRFLKFFQNAQDVRVAHAIWLNWIFYKRNVVWIINISVIRSLSISLFSRAYKWPFRFGYIIYGRMRQIHFHRVHRT